MALLTICLVGTPVFADSHGKFSGKGSIDSFTRACDVANKAVEYSKSGDYATAIKYDKEAISIYPFDSGWYHNLGNYLAKLGQFDEARKAQEQAIELEPKYTGAWLSIGTTYEKQKKLVDAERYYRKAIALEPNCWEALGDLGDILRQQGKFEESLKWLSRAKTCPENVQYPGDVDKVIEMCRQQRKEASN